MFLIEDGYSKTIELNTEIQITLHLSDIFVISYRLLKIIIETLNLLDHVDKIKYSEISNIEDLYKQEYKRINENYIGCEKYGLRCIAPTINYDKNGINTKISKDKDICVIIKHCDS